MNLFDAIGDIFSGFPVPKELAIVIGCLTLAVLPFYIFNKTEVKKSPIEHTAEKETLPHKVGRKTKEATWDFTKGFIGIK